MSNKKLINKGTGAGGANTNHNGLAFEELTNSEKYLYDKGFTKKKMNKNKNGYYLELLGKPDDNFHSIIYMKQSGFKTYINKNIDKTISIYRNPDEAYLIKLKNNKYHLKIIEKKNQNVDGSVEDKLKTGSFNREEYILMFENFKDITIDYSFCVSEFLEKKLESDEIKYINIKKINEKHNIKTFYGNNSNYFDKLYEWINNF